MKTGTWHVAGRRAVWAAIALAAALGGCAAPPEHPWRSAEKTLIWPLPPETPRIRYEGAITADQLGRFTRGARRLLDLLVGPRRLEMRTPHGVAVDGRTLAAADSSLGVVHLLDLQRGVYRAIEQAGRTPLRCPIGVALDGKGGVFVSDSVLARVFHFTGSGRLAGEVDGAFVRPTGLAYEAETSRLYVVDTGAHTVLCFDVKAGGATLIKRIGGRDDRRGGFNFPTHVALGGKKRLHVSDSLNFRVQEFDLDGTPVAAFGKAGDGTGDFSKAKGVAVDSEDHVYVVDSLFDVVQIFDREGRFLLSFGGSGREEGLLWLPSGLCIDERDRIYVADSGNSRILVYQYLRAGLPAGGAPTGAVEEK